MKVHKRRRRQGRTLIGQGIFMTNEEAYAFGVYCCAQTFTEDMALLMIVCALLQLCPDNFSMELNLCIKSQRISTYSRSREKFQRGSSTIWHDIQVLSQQKHTFQSSLDSQVSFKCRTSI